MTVGIVVETIKALLLRWAWIALSAFKSSDMMWLRRWLRRFTAIISACWLWTSKKFDRKKNHYSTVKLKMRSSFQRVRTIRPKIEAHCRFLLSGCRSIFDQLINSAFLFDPGYYCPRETAFQNQFACPNGTYNNKTLAQSFDDCTPCDGGYYCPSLALHEPIRPCSAG